MNDTAEKRCGYVVGPDGLVLTPSNLPQAGRIRWVARRKAELIAAVSGGLITMQDACSRYAISTEEFMDWERRYMRRGLTGLRVSVRGDDADRVMQAAAAEPGNIHL
jgi:hypothetical protein